MQFEFFHAVEMVSKDVELPSPGTLSRLRYESTFCESAKRLPDVSMAAAYRSTREPVHLMDVVMHKGERALIATRKMKRATVKYPACIVMNLFAHYHDAQMNIMQIHMQRPDKVSSDLSPLIAIGSEVVCCTGAWRPNEASAERLFCVRRQCLGGVVSNDDGPRRKKIPVGPIADIGWHLKKLWRA